MSVTAYDAYYRSPDISAPPVYGQGLPPNPLPSTGGPGGARPLPDGQVTTPNPGTQSVGWDDYLASFGLPADVRTTVNQMIAAGRSPQEIIAFVRGTPWYAATYPGISEGISRGIVSNEADYRAYLNAANQQSLQYRGVPVTSAELAAWLKEGVTVDTVGKRFAGAAYAKTYGPEAQYEAGAFGDTGTGQTAAGLSPDQLKAWGEQNAGLGSSQGLDIQAALDRAIVRMRGAFAGRAATPNLGIGGAGLAAPGLAGTRGGAQSQDIAS